MVERKQKPGVSSQVFLDCCEQVRELHSGCSNLKEFEATSLGRTGGGRGEYERFEDRRRYEMSFQKIGTLTRSMANVSGERVNSCAA